MAAGIDGGSAEQRMDCCEIAVTHGEFYHQALVKDCDIFCFSDRIPLTELLESELAGETKCPMAVDLDRTRPKSLSLDHSYGSGRSG